VRARPAFILWGACLGLAGLTMAAELSLDTETLATWERVRPEGAQWAVEGGAWVASAPGDAWWRLLVGGPKRGDGAATVKLRVTKPTPAGGYYDGPNFRRYSCGERDGGYDAAVVLRYQSPNALYRFQLSTAYGELALWKPSGGFLQVKPFAFKPNETYELRVEASGQRLRASVNGNLLIEFQQVIPRGTKHSAHYRVLAYDAAKAKQLFAASKLLPAFDNDREYPVFVTGLNDFKLARRYRDPHGEWAWEGGAWDKAVGHGDAFSLRLDRAQPGVSQAACTTGSSFFMDGYADGFYELSAWVKTRDVTGKGATLFVWTNDGKEQKTTYCPQRLTGTQDWTRLSFRPDNVRAATWHVRLGLELDGAGTAWFDDVELKRIGDLPKAR